MSKSKAIILGSISPRWIILLNSLASLCNAISIHYLGCFVDAPDRAIDGPIFHNQEYTTPQVCAEKCIEEGFHIIGVQNSFQCFCGNGDYARHGPSTGCNFPCAGDSEQICGGHWANSVYIIAETAPPTASPTSSLPTGAPTTAPPTQSPTPMPTASPTPTPTQGPSPQPTPSPTAMPTLQPTQSPTPMSTDSPTPRPTAMPTPQPTQSPTPMPTLQPTQSPTLMPTASPTPPPTPGPSPQPTQSPTAMPTLQPTQSPTPMPTTLPTYAPVPTTQETRAPPLTDAPTSKHTFFTRTPIQTVAQTTRPSSPPKESQTPEDNSLSAWFGRLSSGEKLGIYTAIAGTCALILLGMCMIECACIKIYKPKLDQSTSIDPAPVFEPTPSTLEDPASEMIETECSYQTSNDEFDNEGDVCGSNEDYGQQAAITRRVPRHILEREQRIVIRRFEGERVVDDSASRGSALFQSREPARLLSRGYRGTHEGYTPTERSSVPEAQADEIEMNRLSVKMGDDQEDSLYDVVENVYQSGCDLPEQSEDSDEDLKQTLDIKISGTQAPDPNGGANDEGKLDDEEKQREEKKDSFNEGNDLDPLLKQRLHTKSKSALSSAPASPILSPSGDRVDLQAMRCPITLELMSEPVLLFADGHTYEKQALDQWFATGRRLSPITGEQIASTNYMTNWTVKSLVEEYLTKHPQFQKQEKPEDAEQRSLEAAVALRERDMEAAARKISILKRDNDDLKTNSNKHDEILKAISRVSTQVDAGFSKMSTHLAELGLEVFSRLPGGNVPRLFVVLPDEWFSGKPRLFAKVKSVFTSKWRVLPLCEGNDRFSECHINAYHEGYTISISRQWLQKSLPVIKVALKVVCVATQVASSGSINLGPLAGLLPTDTKEIIKLSDTLSKSVGMVEDSLDPKSITSLLSDERMMREGSAELATILEKEEDKTGGLQQMYNASNQVVWVCRDHTHGLVGLNQK